MDTILRAQPLTPGICEWCGDPTSRPDAIACTLTHEAMIRRLEGERGRTVLRALMRWRKTRGRRGESDPEGSIVSLSRLVDSFLQEDRLRRERAQQARRLKEQEAHASEGA